ncbi:MAG: hypothetical protein Q4D45_08555 [Lachnospiraceae bacterium]|nr:hypothetical protein [Lachnospiraceae bacterium]
MQKEMKICLPFYKMAYSFFFVAVLSLIRGVNFTYEIGVALEPQMALLTGVVCADTYVQEIVSKRSEVERLYPLKKRISSIFKRIAIQESYLLVLSVIGYGLFYLFQNPNSFDRMGFVGAESEQRLFLFYIVAIVITLFFWGLFSLTISCLFRNMWAGIGGCLILWIITYSTFGERFFGKWNLFSYAFRNIENSGDMSWIYGKFICIVLCFTMVTILPKLIKKRG